MNENQTERKLPLFLIEKSNNYWIIWDTTTHEVVGTYETKLNAEAKLKTL